MSKTTSVINRSMIAALVNELIDLMQPERGSRRSESDINFLVEVKEAITNEEYMAEDVYDDEAGETNEDSDDDEDY